MAKASILTIGDEICIGQVVNTNATYIASKLVNLGIGIKAHSVVEDDKNMIKSEITRLWEISDIIIATGGLGPTHDDITKDTLLEYFDDKLVLNEGVLKFLEAIMAKRSLPLTERNRLQAYVPSKCIALINKYGTAPGMFFEKDGKILISLPGVPSEMRGLMDDHVVGIMQTKLAMSKESVIVYKTLHAAGITESNLADLIGEPEEFLKGCTLAFLPSYRGIRLRIGCEGITMEEGKEKVSIIECVIRERAGKYIFGEGDATIQSRLGDLLREKGLTISVAESCTGGMLGGALTETSGSSEYFIGGVIVYSNDAKISVVGVDPETLEKFGAVSEETALELANNTRIEFNTDISLSITGIAGPHGGTVEKPVGTVWIGYSDKDNTFAVKHAFFGDRQVVRERAVGAALIMAYKRLNEM